MHSSTDAGAVGGTSPLIRGARYGKVGIDTAMEPKTHPQTTPENTDSRLPSIERGFAFHFASEYFDRRWSVLPLRGKRPAVPSWRECQVKPAGLDELRTWFHDGKTNVGVVTGRVSGLVVIDCDTAVDARFWKDRFPQTPLAVWTGGGGSHYYYRYPEAQDISNRTGLLARRIDLRAEGGYVVAPSFASSQRQSLSLAGN